MLVVDTVVIDNPLDPGRQDIFLAVRVLGQNEITVRYLFIKIDVRGMLPKDVISLLNKHGRPEVSQIFEHGKFFLDGDLIELDIIDSSDDTVMHGSNTYKLSTKNNPNI